MSTNIFISLGTNLGHKMGNLNTAMDEILKKGFRILRKSSVYKTEPMGITKQPEFLNMVIEINTTCSPSDLLISLLAIEDKMGRKRTKKWGPRIIDIDILLYADQIIHKENIDIPHPLMHKRNFVLIPLVEIAPELVHPELLQPFKDYIPNNIEKVEKI